MGQAAHHLAAHVDLRSAFEFMVVFGLIWTAWVNGSLYHEIHGRDDGRHRTYILIQMYLLVVLAVFTPEATGERGPAFALTYAALTTVVALQWFAVWRRDTVASFRRSAGQFLIGISVFVAIILVSAFVSEDVRLGMWAFAVLVIGFGATTAQSFLARRGPEGAPVEVTESMVERFHLFTIIVLGEVVVGVTNGILETGASNQSILIGLVALSIGVGFWWNYFDTFGRALPRNNSRAMSVWQNLHLPMQGTIAAAGAGMVSLIEHADDPHLPGSTTWLLAGSVAFFYLLLSAISLTINYPPAIRGRLRRVQVVCWAGVLACVALAFAEP